MANNKNNIRSIQVKKIVSKNKDNNIHVHVKITVYC